MSDLADTRKTGRKPRYELTTDAQFAAAGILAILIVAQLMLVAQNRETVAAAAQFAPFGIFAP
jgi:hypothetical protein